MLYRYNYSFISKTLHHENINSKYSFQQEKDYAKAIADYDILIGLHRYTLKRPWMYCFRAEAKIMIDDATACEDIKLAIKYAKTGFGEEYFTFLQKTHCGRSRKA